MSTLGIHSTEDLQEDIQCPVCFKVPRSTPIYQCSEGHIHCKSCHPKLQSCPVCRAEIGNIRNLMLERIISRLPTRCNFFEHGCMIEKQLPKDMLNHESSCNFRVIKCMFSDCTDTFPISDTMDHIKMKHSEVHLEKKSTVTFQVPLGENSISHDEVDQKSWTPKYLSLKGKDFFVLYYLTPSDLFVLKIFLVGSQVDITRDGFDFVAKAFLKTDDEDIEVTSKGLPLSLFGEKHGYASMVLDRRQVRSMADEKDNLNIAVTITSHVDIPKEELIVVDTIATNFIEACYYGGEKTLEEILKKYPENKTFNINAILLGAVQK